MFTNLKSKLFNEYTFFLFGLVVVIISFYGYINRNLEPAEVGQVIGAQTFLNSKGELVVKYAFVGSNMDIAVSDNVQQTAKEQKLELVAEDLSARTSSSRTFVTDKPDVRISEFISGPQYYEDDLGMWWQAEYAYVTPEQFALLPKTPLYARLHDTSKFAFVKRALATTDTFYPNPNPETTSVDGIMARTTDGTWTEVRTGIGESSSDTLLLGSFRLQSAATTNVWSELDRAIFGFDTSSIPDTDTIDSATVSFYGSSRTDNFSQSIVLDRRVPTSPTAITTGDYNLSGWNVVEQATGRITIASWSITGYNDFTLNATGLSNISKTGVSWYGLRLSADFDNSEPTWAASLNANINVYFADQTGTDKDPKLVVVHTAPPPASGSIFNQDVIFNQEVIFQ